jgi:hypothetical protein
MTTYCFDVMTFVGRVTFFTEGLIGGFVAV